MMNEVQIAEVFGCYLRGEWPNEAEIATAPRISNWLVVVSRSKPYEMHLSGECVGHPDIPDGTISTSPLIWIDKMRRLAQTSSRLYVLA